MIGSIFYTFRFYIRNSIWCLIQGLAMKFRYPASNTWKYRYFCPILMGGEAFHINCFSYCKR